MQKQYFYIEDGKQKKYIYCSLCGNGPFKESDTDKFTHICGNKQKVCYCNECKSRHIKPGAKDEDWRKGNIVNGQQTEPTI
jgi:hypothetical protein